MIAQSARNIDKTPERSNIVKHSTQSQRSTETTDQARRLLDNKGNT